MRAVLQYRNMRYRRNVHPPAAQINDAAHDRIVKVLSLEYQTLREEILLRTSGRFQFLGLMTTAAAILSTVLFGNSIFGRQSWIAATLAAIVFGFGLLCFAYLGRTRVHVSIRIAAIEKRINALVPSESGHSAVLTWESEHQHRNVFQRLKLGLLPRRAI